MTTNDDMDAVFAALAHTSRRRMLDIIRDAPGVTVGKLASHFDVSRITVMQHLAVLEGSGLVIGQKDGRSRKLFLNAVPLQEIHARWIDQYAAHWGDRALFIKQVAEAAAAKRNSGDDDG
ncbi:helix-turn-helix transcriptional regulator [Maritimibacter sp. DP1N21-5]|uniref:ArsR/SmtB family transcription factor n=1 Tax=Maritimibacter sp. DP1N21-5 TaxID=2836867 RepID=UPI001C467544|nr:helix-turn-helix transcriptional regulator [Maritimibacter sp. DP1N21-5]MBV7410040.1 ArsR family transcriptional regulator [Maritimibacter sp. DP1N21-5]